MNNSIWVGGSYQFLQKALEVRSSAKLRQVPQQKTAEKRWLIYKWGIYMQTEFIEYFDSDFRSRIINELANWSAMLLFLIYLKN